MELVHYCRNVCSFALLFYVFYETHHEKYEKENLGAIEENLKSFIFHII